MATYTKAQQWKKEESERLRGDRDTALSVPSSAKIKDRAPNASRKWIIKMLLYVAFLADENFYCMETQKHMADRARCPERKLDGKKNSWGTRTTDSGLVL